MNALQALGLLTSVLDLDDLVRRHLRQMDGSGYQVAKLNLTPTTYAQGSHKSM
jgi:hypothetical protein